MMVGERPTVEIPRWGGQFGGGEEIEAVDSPVDAYTCDEFRMYEFKVRRCGRARPHDWTDCPYAHPGEKARRRDPRKVGYAGAPCADFRKGGCGKGDACELAHGVFECWLHPDRYRTQPCKDGLACRRRVCFFAHTADQLRLPPPPSPAPLDDLLASLRLLHLHPWLEPPARAHENADDEVYVDWVADLLR
ncbi:zinc finger CCCH domain-containing protein 2-like [Wolffia australiana]